MGEYSTFRCPFCDYPVYFDETDCPNCQETEPMHEVREIYIDPTTNTIHAQCRLRYGDETSRWTDCEWDMEIEDGLPRCNSRVRSQDTAVQDNELGTLADFQRADDSSMTNPLYRMVEAEIKRLKQEGATVR